MATGHNGLNLKTKGWQRVELTYELRGNGYAIKRNGIDWIIQESYFPYPATTVEESAQLHIQDIQDSEGNATSTENELLLAVAELGAIVEQDKMETQLAIAELAAIVTGGEV